MAVTDATTAGTASSMTNAPATFAEAILTLAETAPYFRKTPRTMWNWRAAGTYPVRITEINGRPYVRVVDLEEFFGRTLDQLRVAS